MAVKRYAVSNGEMVEIPDGVPDSFGALTLQQIFNITYNVQCDLNGNSILDSEEFPDGHIASPFAAKLWKIVRADELEDYFGTLDSVAIDAARQADEERRKKYAEQSARWFESFGRFVVGFEQLCTSLAQLIRYLVQRNGIEGREVADILIADHAARELASLAETLFTALPGVASSDLAIAKKIFARVTPCYEARNDIVHTFWLPGGMGACGADDFTVARGVRYKKKPSEGTASRQILYGPKELDFLRRQCVATAMLVGDISTSVLQKVPLSQWLALDGTTIKRTLNLVGGALVESYPAARREPPIEAGVVDSEPEKSAATMAVRARQLDELKDVAIATWDDSSAH